MRQEQPASDSLERASRITTLILPERQPVPEGVFV